MNREEALERALEFKAISEKCDEVSFIDRDTEFFEYVIKELTAQEVPVQEQLCGINKKVDSIQICLTIFSVTIIVMLINVLFNWFN